MCEDFHQLFWLSEAKLDVVIRVVDNVFQLLWDVEFGFKLLGCSLLDYSLLRLLLLAASDSVIIKVVQLCHLLLVFKLSCFFGLILLPLLRLFGFPGLLLNG